MAGSAERLDLAETEGASRKPTKAMEFSPQVTQFFNPILPGGGGSHCARAEFNEL